MQDEKLWSSSSLNDKYRKIHWTEYVLLHDICRLQIAFDTVNREALRNILQKIRCLATLLPFPFIPTLIGLQAFDLVSSLVWWEAATHIIKTDSTVYRIIFLSTLLRCRNLDSIQSRYSKISLLWDASLA